MTDFISRHKWAMVYLAFVTAVTLLVVTATARADTGLGRQSFKVGTKNAVSLKTNFVNGDPEDYLRIWVYVDGKETINVEAAGKDCAAYFYAKGVTVKVDACKEGQHMKVRAANASSKTRRITVKWMDLLQSGTRAKS